MEVRVGTSGFSYAEWKGAFYPPRLRPADMLGYYAEHLPTVEINSTFYRMPRASMLEGWGAKVPEGFRFVLKASRRITHHGSLAPETREGVMHLWQMASHLGATLGPILFQLPPHMDKDVERLRSFLSMLPPDMRVALEFRHPSWFDQAVYDALRHHGAALVAADFPDPARDAPLIPTADFGYARLRNADYDDIALARWAAHITAQPWREAYVFFKHEDEGKAPALAQRMLHLLAKPGRRSH
jgi:uncharacterized protein YecE (DUF72 family)